MKYKKNILVLSSPSGGGKSTIAKYILENFKDVHFSISATTRNMRPGEINGTHYHFLSVDEFDSKIKNDELIEYEMIFNNYYGTLKSVTIEELEKDKILLFDVDVKGALSIKKHFPDNSLLIFIAPPSIEVLEQRLKDRNTESEEQLKIRIDRTKLEMSYCKDFDYTIINDVLDDTLLEINDVIRKEIYADNAK